ncbi:molybdopterin-synthase adenylyltransferase MoeB [Alkalilimnicola ehrlichii]|uniref:molybdopterin-synthase adenylyltransferase MoeB n=1 Tax=Alkalilimnicola ehrlichii TaxID=351052 RepID=UPI003BA1927A
MSETSVTVRLPAPLRPFAGDQPELHVPGASVGEVLDALARDYPLLHARLVDPDGELRAFVNLFRGEQDVRELAGQRTPLRPGDVLTVLPAVAGGAPSALERLSARIRREVPEVTPAEAQKLAAQGAVLLDVREAGEVAEGSPTGALRIDRNWLELRIEEAVPEPERPILTLCAVGQRSLLAADDLRRLGYRDVRNIAGGFNRWKDEGLPFEVPRVLDDASRARYARHLRMPEVGEAGQLRLGESRVVLVGAGGLGSPAALYLAAAGVGTLVLVDHDVVDRSNLQRQILHTDDRVGQPKTESGRQAVAALNPQVRVEAVQARLNSENIEAVLVGADLVIDGSDNFPTRYLVNDACVKLGLPLVYGAVYRFEGQVTVFNVDDGPCYRCLYPEPPPAELAPSCAQGGVLGVLPGVIGLLQATEAVKLLLGVGEPLSGRLVHYDALRGQFQQLRMKANPDCPVCAPGRPFPGYVDYEAFCSSSA